MRNIALLIEYDGTAYSGWQVQKNGPSIQSVIEKTLSGLLQENIKIIGAGRTDAGVHAYAQVANFHTRSSWEVDKIVYSLNRTLPRDVAINRGVLVADEFHSRFDATARKYLYKVITKKSPFAGHFASYFHFDLSVDLMNEAAKFLLGKRSFKSFTKYSDQQKHFICSVTKAEWKNEIGDMNRSRMSFLSSPSSFLLFEIEANRFLHGMVRAVVGTIIDVGRGKITIEDFKTIVKMEKRSFASMSAPACGLFLGEVKYARELWNG